MVDVAAILTRQHPFRAVGGPRGGWSILYPDLPGCMTYAATDEDIGPMARAAVEGWVRVSIDNAPWIPAPPPYGVRTESFWPDRPDPVRQRRAADGRYRVVGTAQFERADRLQSPELEEDLALRDIGIEWDQRRANHDAARPLLRRQERGQGDRLSRSLRRIGFG